MEVHAHTHTARKKWTHYFWEFLMLFIAVFCGFLAEYKLEHTIEKQRSKVYAEQFYEELKLDTTSISTAAGVFKKIHAQFDTLITITKNGITDDKNWKELYYQAHDIDAFVSVTFHKASFEQIKNSGSLRHFTGAAMVGAIQDYINARDRVEFLQNDMIEYYNYHLTPFVEKNFDTELLCYRTNRFNRSYFDSVWNNSAKPTKFLSENRSAHTEFKNLLIGVKNFFVFEFPFTDLLTKSNRLMTLLKKEYHIK